jgi:hypothetical protein
MEPDDEEVVACARYDELSDLKLLIEAKSNINHHDYNGSSALHMAAGNGFIDIVQYLCDQGIAYTANRGGNFPLHWAALNKHEKVVKLLVTHPTYEPIVDVFSLNQGGKSAVSHAFDNGESETVVLLLAHRTGGKDEKEPTCGDEAKFEV